MSYEKIIGFGGNCEVAEHIRRYTGEKRANIMDWWITPMGSLSRLLDERFANLMRLENMKVINGGMTVMCTHYGIAHHHDFPRLANKRIDVATIPQTVQDMQGKYEMLRERFLADCDGRQRVLFVRTWRDTLAVPSNQQAMDDVQQYDFDGVIADIARAFPHLDFTVLFVNYGVHRSAHPRALFHNISDKGDSKNWAGSPGGWDEMFERFVGSRLVAAA